MHRLDPRLPRHLLAGGGVHEPRSPFINECACFAHRFAMPARDAASTMWTTVSDAPRVAATAHTSAGNDRRQRIMICGKKPPNPGAHIWMAPNFWRVVSRRSQVVAEKVPRPKAGWDWDMP